MYARTTAHLNDEHQWAEAIKAAPAETRDAVFGEAYDAIHARCLSERSGSLDDMMFGTDDDVVRFLAEVAGTKSRALEIGCGCGRASIELARRGHRVTGVDISSVVIENARRFAENVDGVDFHVSSARDLAVAEGEFDFAWSIDVFEHIHPDDVAAHLAAVYRALRPGGRYFIITVNAHLGPHDVSREARGIESFGQEEPIGFHLKEWTFTQLYAELRRAGFGPIRSNALPWRRFPRNVLVPAAMKTAAEAIVRHLPRRARRVYKLAFRLSGLASMVFVAHRPPSR